MAAQPQSEAGLKERFFRYFQQEVTALQEQMERLANTAIAGGERNDAVDHCLAGIARLSREVKDASSYIPAYDQRIYAEAIKALNDKLQKARTAFAPRAKFSFKTAHKNPSTATSSFAPTPLDAVSPVEEKAESGLLVPGVASDPQKGTGRREGTGAATLTISNHNHAHLLLPPTTTNATTTILSNLRHCTVDLSTPSSSPIPPGLSAGLTLKNLKHCLILCGQVSGATHITNVKDSVIVAATGQFRMHGSEGVDVYLHCGSRPIIEDCSDIRFAPLPPKYLTDANSKVPNQWDQVDDFDWLQAEQSPHWSLLPEAARVEERVWREVVPGGPGVGPEEILKAVGCGDKGVK